MSQLMEQAFLKAKQLPEADQDALASRWLEEIEDERRWAASFAATTDEQWDHIIAEVHQDVATRGVRPLDEIFGLQNFRS